MGQTTDAIDGAPLPEEKPRRGMIVTSHPRAAEAGAAAMRAGGTAVDAAVTAAAVLGVVDPMSTGIGGDCFAMVWDGEALHGINGSGRSPAAATLEAIGDGMPERGPLPITVPGALHAWQSLLDRFGERSLEQALTPAIEAARGGFAVTPVVARDWARSEDVLKAGVGMEELLPVPAAGQTVTQPSHAASLELVARDGVGAFYEGELGAAIAQAVKTHGGWLSEEDLRAHDSRWVKPRSVSYRGHPVYQLPPNGQGLVVLQALAMLDEYPLGDMGEEERTHLAVEALKLAFADARAHLGDPEDTPFEALLDPAYLESRLDLLDGFRDRANPAPSAGSPSDTVYVAAVDPQGRCCSLINSVYMHFGAAFGVRGVTLQNRGALFSNVPGHPNAFGPRRLPYHTIIPSMVFRSGVPWLVFGVVGGFQQPQGQVQLLLRLIDEGRRLRDAVDAPRFRWIDGDRLRLEAGTPSSLAEALERRGHVLVDASGHGGFGGAQAILVEDGEPTGASDPRKDGRAITV